MAKTVVIGGGASGLAAAIAAAEAGDDVVVLEASDRVGKKILASGNGRCNLTNTGLSSDDYRNGDFAAPVLDELGPEEIRAWFGRHGLFVVEEREGRVYPLSNTANSVLDVLRATCARLGVDIRTGARVKSLSSQPGGAFELSLEGAQTVFADKAIVACGGGSKLLGSCGHRLVAFEPVLCPIETETADIRGMSGVRARVGLKLTDMQTGAVAFEEEGELLFRDYGVSGIVAFNASRFLESGQQLLVDFIPGVEKAGFESALESRARWAGSYEELLCGIFHPAVNRMLMRIAGVKPSSRPDAGRFAKLACLAKGLKVAVKGPGSPKQAQVTRGGADVRQFDSATLESELVPGLFACGECLDIDGPCGGYNLHWAWASGIVAGRA